MTDKIIMICESEGSLEAFFNPVHLETALIHKFLEISEVGSRTVMFKCVFIRVHLIEIEVRVRLSILTHLESNRARLSLKSFMRIVLNQLNELVNTCFLHFDVHDQDVVVRGGHSFKDISFYFYLFGNR